MIEMNMEFISAIVLLVEFCIFSPLNFYYRRKGRSLPKGDPPEIKKIQRMLIIIANRIFTYILWVAAPILILLDLYRPFLYWTTFTIFFPASINYFWLQLSGMIIFSIGVLIIILARVVIKERHAMTWEPSKKGEGFAKTGIYSKIRHPIYSAVYLFLIGYIIWFQSWLAIICFIFSLLLTKVAIAEEEWLLERFGKEYEEYMKKTGGFFPKFRKSK